MAPDEDLADELRAQIDSHFEWLFVSPTGRTFPLTRAEIDVRFEFGKLVLGVFDDAGFGMSRVDGFSFDGSELLLEISSSFGAEQQQIIRLIPRPSARELTENVVLARLTRANLIGSALVETFPAFKLSRIALNIENGRLAQVVARDPKSNEFALMADVTATMTHESVMTSAIQWSEKLRCRKKPINEMWIAAERKQARPLQRLLALFNPSVAIRFRLFEISNETENPKLKELSRPRSLWRTKAKKLALPLDMEASETAAAIMSLAPDETDLIFSKQGETIRFLGLPFARVRTMAGEQRAWFGVDAHRFLLTDETWPLLVDLVSQLKTHRCPNTENRRHEFYRASPEAWLEAILRRNIKQLDDNLILSPIYNQYRASADKIDLLAIRRDGRLVIIELKTSPDREMVFQAADYWRKIELQRRSGELARNRAFGEMKILDKAALVYAVAPALSFHRDFALFAAMLKSEVEIWRFELREDWRSQVKVLGRTRYEK